VAAPGLGLWREALVGAGQGRAGQGRGGGGGAAARATAPEFPVGPARERAAVEEDAEARMAASALYACTKCTQRYPFEELSQGQQLCKVRGGRAGGRRVGVRRPRGPGFPRAGHQVGRPGRGAATCRCRRDPMGPRLRLFRRSPARGTGGRRLHFLARTRSRHADASSFPVQESRATGWGPESSDLELLPSH
jgi:hypothetical protein